ncbi:MAG TPA: hypothetical protein VHB97_09910 [Polyangia bacterium]|jgi:hypothetical protein|nr:hypothetical protein [Polyangia bacterium]
MATEARLNEERKREGSPAVVTGRLEELRRLEAAERALADAFCAYARAAEGGSRLLHLSERHLQIAGKLADRIVALGGSPEVDPDDQWLIGPPDRLETIIYAEQSALRTYHDHLLDMDPETMVLIRDHVLAAHQSTLELLTGERGHPQPSVEYG